MINMSSNELPTRYQQINHCLFLKDNKTVIKNCLLSFNCPDCLDERLLFVYESNIGGLYTKPLELYQDDRGIYGYETIYLKDYLTMHQLIKSNMSVLEKVTFDDKKRAILGLSKTLQTIHEFYVLGDINSNNILMNQNGEAYFIDWENGSPFKCSYPLPTLCQYEINECHNPKLEDNLKLFINSISLLYEVDFERLFMNLEIAKMINILEALKIHPNLIAYIKDIQQNLLSGCYYNMGFDEYLKDVKTINSKTRKRIQLNVSVNYHNFY